MEHLELLSKTLRYAGLNLSPQIIQVILVIDEPTVTLIKNLNITLTKNPNPTLSEIDAIVLEIQQARANVEATKAAKEVTEEADVKSAPLKRSSLDKK